MMIMIITMMITPASFDLIFGRFRNLFFLIHGSVFELNNHKTRLIFYFYYYSQLLKNYNELQRSIQFSLKHVDYNTII